VAARGCTPAGARAAGGSDAEAADGRLWRSDQKSDRGWHWRVHPDDWGIKPREENQASATQPTRRGTTHGIGFCGQLPGGSSTHSAEPATRPLGQMFFLRLHLYWAYIATKWTQNGHPPPQRLSSHLIEFIYVLWSHPPGLNRRPADCKSQGVPSMESDGVVFQHITDATLSRWDLLGHES